MATKKAPAKKAAAADPAQGALTWTDDFGFTYSPIACGEHRSVPVYENSTDDEPGSPAGFQPKCADCQYELESAKDAALRNNSREPEPV